jgi:hypothetical protein
MEAPMTTITPEQRKAVREAGAEPVRLTDPESNDAYYLIKEEVFERVRDAIQPRSVLDLEIPEGILQAQDAFFRDLPRLLEDRKLAGKWVAYTGTGRVKVGRTQREVIEECLRRGLPSDQYDVFIIRPQSREPEEVDGGPYEFEEFLPEPDAP